ncbi:hypothetical protein WJX81_007193 [Elliptochloris bilobata]|uniref:Protein kinase domain-containing protein n=1 Tax=Elliptochloris bilobata TaxID=381761 RepID=A0AAW1S964_9CHLO
MPHFGEAPPLRRMLFPGCTHFAFEELAVATGGWAAGNVIGSGGFGSVYAGRLSDGTAVAIKRLDRRGLQGDKEFNTEAALLARLRHPHVVALLGVCAAGNHRIAVTELARRGSLRGALDRSALGWRARVAVALGIARGVAYLHEVVHPPLVHRDLTSGNILLGADGRALIADFGLARTLGHKDDTLPSLAPADGASVVGTHGYVAPEYARTGELSQASDTYSVGVLLLELLTGLPAADGARAPGHHLLAESLAPRLNDVAALQAFLDPSLRAERVPTPQLAAVAEAAAACLQPRPADRPPMGEAEDAATPLAAGLRFGAWGAAPRPWWGYWGFVAGAQQWDARGACLRQPIREAAGDLCGGHGTASLRNPGIRKPFPVRAQ